MRSSDNDLEKLVRNSGHRLFKKNNILQMDDMATYGKQILNEPPYDKYLDLISRSTKIQELETLIFKREQETSLP